MLKLVDILLSVQAAVVLGNTLSLKVDGYCLGSSLDSYFSSAVSGRNGVIIRIEADGAEPIHPPGNTLTSVEGITGQRIQLFSLPGEHFPHRGFFAANLVGQVAQALFLEHSFQFLQAFHLGNRNADVAADIAHQTFYEPFFITGCWIAEYRFKAIVRGLRRDTNAYYAAMYLLTSNDDIYRRTANCFCKDGIEFGYAVLKNTSPHNYALFMAARDLCDKTEAVTMADLAEPEVIDPEALRLIVNATLIARYGLAAFQIRARGAEYRRNARFLLYVHLQGIEGRKTRLLR